MIGQRNLENCCAVMQKKIFIILMNLFFPNEEASLVTHAEQKDKNVRGTKQEKQRITVLFGASMSGEKLLLLVIGHNANPRGFKGARIPVEYYFNSKAWMNSKLFNDILKRFERKMGLQKCKVLVFVDNCPLHPNISLENIKLQFFPPNVTSKYQPLDQGIIASFKTHYKNEIQLRTVRALNIGVRQPKLAHFECLFIASNAWRNSVKASTIKHCFRKAGFKLTNNEIEEIFDDSMTGML